MLYCRLIKYVVSPCLVSSYPIEMLFAWSLKYVIASRLFFMYIFTETNQFEFICGLGQEQQYLWQEEARWSLSVDPDFWGHWPGGHCLPAIWNVATLGSTLSRRQRPSWAVCPYPSHRCQWASHVEPHGCAGSCYAAGQLWMLGRFGIKGYYICFSSSLQCIMTCYQHIVKW